MPDISALYPQPQPPQNGALLSDPSKLYGFIAAAQAAKMFAAKQALGRAYQNNLNPDGTPNLPGVAQDLKNDPSAGIMMPEATNNILAQHGQMIANDTASFDQYAKQSGFVQNWLASRVNQPNLTADDIHNDAATLARNTDPKALPSQVINSVADSIINDPGGIRAGILNARNRIMGAVSATTPIPGPPTASGATRTIPLGATGYPQTGEIPGQIITENPPGTQQSTELMQADAARAGNFGQEIFPWQQALQKIQALGPGGLGPGTKGRQDFESFLYAAAPGLSTMLGVNPQKIQNYAEAEKYLTNATQQRAAGFGSHTDMQLATALSGSPNVHINDLAAEDVTKAAIALRRMEHAQYTMNSGAIVNDPISGAQKPGGAVNYATNKAAWAATQDPRAYAIDMMTPEQVANLQKTLKGAERAKFNASLKAAISSGVITPPGQ